MVGFGLLLVPSAAWSASASLNAPTPNAVFYTGAANGVSVSFSATRSSSDCTIQPTAQTFGMYIRLPGDTFSIFAMSISDEDTISARLGPPKKPPAGVAWERADRVPIFETVLGGLTVRGSIVGTHRDLEKSSAASVRPGRRSSAKSGPSRTSTEAPGQALTYIAT